MAKHNDIGKMGEDIAAQFLLDNGFEIIERNWRFKKFEVDIIASKNDTLHIIEVKTRLYATQGNPEENFTASKMKFLVKAAEEFTFLHPQWTRLQYDIVSVTTLPQPEVFYIEDVFYF